jgi:hypothetical protein
VADDLIGQFGIDLFQKIDGDPISYEPCKEDQHGKSHEENEQEDEKSEQLHEHIPKFAQK